MRRAALVAFAAVLWSCTQSMSLAPGGAPLHSDERSQALTYAPELELIPTATNRGDPIRIAQNVSVAGIGGNPLAVWEDTRFGLKDTRIMGTWLSGGGVGGPNATRFILAPGNLAQTLPHAVGGANAYLVTYVSGGFGAQQIMGVWVSNATGLPGPAFHISPSFTSQGSPRVAVDLAGVSGPVFVVMWQDVDQVGPLKAVALAEGATTPSVGPLNVGVGMTQTTQPTLAFNGTNFVCGWQESRGGTPSTDIYLVSFSPTTLTGTSTVGTAPITTGTAARSFPTLIGGSGGQVLLDYSVALGGRVAVRVNSSLASIDATPFSPFGTNASIPFGYYDTGVGQYTLYAPAATFPTTGFVGVQIAPASGALTSQTPINNVAKNAGGLAVSRWLNVTANNPYIAWADPGLAEGTKVRSLMVNGQLSRQVSEGEESQEHSSAAAFSSGTEAVVAWAHNSSYPFDAGTAADIGYRVYREDGGHSAPVLLARPSTQTAPSAATIGEQALVGFSDGLGTSVALFNAATPATSTLFTIGNPGGSAVVAGAVGGRFLVVWNAQTFPNSVRYTLIAPNATGPDGGATDVPTGSNLNAVQTLAFAADPGSGGLIALAAGSNLFGPDEIRVLRVDEDGGFGPGTLLSSTATGSPTDSIVSADFDGTNFFVVWVDTRNPVTTPDVFGARVTPTGTVLDPGGVPLVVGPEITRDVRVAFDGTHHVLATSMDRPDGGSDIALEWLRPDLSLLYDGGLIASDPNKEPALAALSNGSTLVAFTRSVRDPAVEANRAFATVVTVGLGDFCASAADCLSGFCTRGICCSAACNRGCETCSAAAGATADGTCTPLAVNTVCRANNDGGCDVAEVCDGVTGTCPVDGFAATNTVCRPASLGGCDQPEVCTGLSPSCPPDKFTDAGTVCTNQTATCAVPGMCSGTTDVCPVAGTKQAGFVCRPADGGCDVQEQCDGTHQTCPPDGFVTLGSVCRPSAGECDVAEACTGASPACPPDLFNADNHVCRAAAGACDAQERCDGTTATCPADGYLAAGAQCRAAADVCDVAESCDGGSVDCPTDEKATTTSICRPASSSGCDVAETCDGVNNACPPDKSALDGEACMPGPGVCEAGVCQAESSLTKRSRYGFGCGNCSSGGFELFGALGLFWFLRRRRKGLTALLPFVVAGVLSSFSAHAQPKPIRVAFLGVANGEGISAESAKTLSETAQTLMSRIGPFSVIGPSEIGAMLGAERQKQLLGCSDTSCAAELAGALDTDRLVSGNASRLDDAIILNLFMVDARTGTVIGRVVRQTTGGVSTLLKELEPAVYELANLDPLVKTKLTRDPGFGGLVVSVRADGDVLGLRLAGEIAAEYSGRWVGAALTLIPKVTFGVRGEGRFYPFATPLLRPYLGVGLTAFSTGIAVRAAAGLALRVSSLQFGVDAAYEYTFADFAPLENYSPHAVLIGAWVGWNFSL